MEKFLQKTLNQLFQEQARSIGAQQALLEFSESLTTEEWMPIKDKLNKLQAFYQLKSKEISKLIDKELGIKNGK